MSDETDEIWELYADDGAQALDAMEDALQALGEGRGNAAAHVSALFRAVHTFKGNSRVLGLAVVEGRAHLAEDLIGLVRDEGVPLSEAILAMLVRACDTFRGMLEATAATRADVDPAPSEALAADLAALIGTLQADPAPESTAEAMSEAPQAEAPAPEPEPEPEPEPIAKAEAPAAPRLADDPAYRKIFLDMAAGTIAELADLMAEPGADLASRADKALSALGHAASQMGLEDWRAAIATGTPASAETLARTAEALRGLQRALEGGEADAGGLDAAFFADLAAIFRQVSDVGLRLTGDAPAGDAERDALHRDITALIAPHGIPRVAAAAETLRAAVDPLAYKTAELQFYEELARLEQGIDRSGIDSDVILPGTLLRAWCADHVFDTLQALRVGLDAPRRAGRPDWFPDFEGLMQRVFHASRHFHIETAAQLTMALIDLFARMRMEGGTPDALLIQIARGFVDTMELVFDALDQGDAPDMVRIEQLFEEASNVCFVASGMATAKSIEKRLGLPPDFHRVLSPESVKAAQSAIDAGLRFHVVRADLNGDEALAERFLEWITGDRMRMITNVTVFECDATLFDFLLAAPLTEPRMLEALADVDPGGRHLSLRLALSAEQATEEPAPDEAEAPAPSTGGAAVTLQMLEAIGEISAGQAMVDHMLGELGAADLLHDIDIDLRTAGLPALDKRVRGVLRDRIERHGAALQRIAEAGSQISAQLLQLQEDSTAMRTRPAEALLAPLAAHVSAEARKAGHEARLSHTGAEIVLDQMVIEDLRRILKPLLAARLAAPSAPRRIHLTLAQQEDRVILDILDDGAFETAPPPAIAALADALRGRQGEFRRIAQPGGGTRHHIAVPLQMIVMDVMVLRVGDVRYVLPVSAIQRIHQSRDILTVSASEGRRMLRLDDGRIVPIRALPRVGAAREGDAQGLYVIAASGDAQIAIPVDELLGQQLVLRRPLRGVLAGLRDLAGIAILSGGEIGMVVAVGSLAQGQAGPGQPRAAARSIPLSA